MEYVVIVVERVVLKMLHAVVVAVVMVMVAMFLLVLDTDSVYCRASCQQTLLVASMFGHWRYYLPHKYYYYYYYCYYYLSYQ
jgi:hypothetical protein